MSREAHAGFYERPGVRFPPATHPIFAAFERGDYSSAEWADSEIEIEIRSPGFAEGTYRGHAGLRQLLEDFWSQFDNRRSAAKEYIQAGDEVVTSAVHHGRGKKSGIEVAMHDWQVSTLRDGKVVGWRVFSTRRETLEAAGLQE